jgi:predicted KAP-like P-loop ATPase
MRGDLLTKDEEEQKLYKEAVKSLVEATSQENREAVEEAIGLLFPAPYESSDEKTENWFKGFRICDNEAFDRYFILSLPAGAVSNCELVEILTVVGDADALSNRLKKYHEEHRLLDLLRYLNVHVKALNLDYAEALTTAMLNIGDLCENKQDARKWFNTSTDHYVESIVYRILKRQDNDHKRVATLLASIQQTSGLFIPLAIVGQEIHRRKENPRHCIVPETALNSLKEACLIKIRTWSQNQQLSKHIQLKVILHYWRDWAGPSEPAEWIKDLITTKEGLRAYLGAFLARITPDDVASHVSLLGAIRSMELLFPLSEVSQQVQVFKSQDGDKDLIKLFEDGLEQWTIYQQQQQSNTSNSSSPSPSGTSGEPG